MLNTPSKSALDHFLDDESINDIKQHIKPIRTKMLSPNNEKWTQDNQFRKNRLKNAFIH